MHITNIIMTFFNEKTLYMKGVYPTLFDRRPIQLLNAFKVVFFILKCYIGQNLGTGYINGQQNFYYLQ